MITGHYVKANADGWEKVSFMVILQLRVSQSVSQSVSLSVCMSVRLGVESPQGLMTKFWL